MQGIVVTTTVLLVVLLVLLRRTRTRAGAYNILTSDLIARGDVEEGRSPGDAKYRRAKAWVRNPGCWLLLIDAVGRVCV